MRKAIFLGMIAFSILSWLLGVFYWVRHNDHATLAWFAGSVLSSNWIQANVRIYTGRAGR